MGAARIIYLHQTRTPTVAVAAVAEPPLFLLYKGLALAICFALQLLWLVALVDAARAATPFFNIPLSGGI